MKKTAIFLMIAILLPQAGFAGKKAASFKFADIPWGAPLTEAVSILEEKDYTVSQAGAPEDSLASVVSDPDVPRYELEKDFLNTHPGTVELYGNANDGLWKVRILIVSPTDLRESFIDGILVKKYGKPNDPHAGSEFITSSGYERKWNKSADKSEINIDCRWTKENGTKEQHLEITYQKPDLVERKSRAIERKSMALDF